LLQPSGASLHGGCWRRPSGYYTDPKRQCNCTPNAIERYLSRISGPLIDRIDIHVEVPPVPWRQLRGEHDGLSSIQMREQVVAARQVQRRRFAADISQPETISTPDGGPPSGNPPLISQGFGGKESAIGSSDSTTTNATMTSRQVRRFCKLDAAGEAMLKQAMTEMGLSARAHDKVLRIARTIADMEGAADVASQHLGEAIQYRRLDRKF